MPTYVYECNQCRQVFEAEQRIIEPPLTTCLCGAEGTIKCVIQPIAVLFKGSGFHINDYADKGGKTEEVKAAKPEASESANAPATEEKPPATPAPEPAPAAPVAKTTE